jgi:two-component sensor histidine kinase
VARFDEVARERTDLSEADLEHLRALVGDWTLLSDLAFADLVLWLPTWHGGGFVAADQVRPATGPTLFDDDLVGQYVPRGRRPVLDQALAARTVMPARRADRPGLPATEEAIPVVHAGRVVAVLGRHSEVAQRLSGRLESTYLETADELVAMVVDGSFPPAKPLGRTGTPPRVGDGLIRIDAAGTVTFASPNARSAYHRLGLGREVVGLDLARVSARLVRRPGPVDEALAAVATGRAAGGAEVGNDNAVVTLRGVPLLRDGVRSGALVLVRDATEIRRRDRALVGKDATIREIHHRVKNNLQTVAALLRLQSRRLESAEARAALDEAVRRVGSIALVHDALSLVPGEQVSGDEVVDRLVGLLREMSPGGGGAVTVVREGRIGVLPAEIVTALTMALSELAQNAMEHGRPGAEGDASTILVAARRTAGRLEVSVADSGPGIAEGVDPFATGRLGLQIVRALVSDELGGRLDLSPRPEGGTVATVSVPLPGAAPRPAPSEPAGPPEPVAGADAAGAPSER